MSHMSLASIQRVVRHTSGDNGFVTRHVAGETIIVPVSSRVGDLDAIYTLNDVGSRVWTLVESPKSVAEIVSVLCEEYDASPDQITNDTVELLQQLEASGLINFLSGSDA